MSVKHKNGIAIEYVLQRPEGSDDPDSFFFSSYEVGEEVEVIPSGYEIYEDPEDEVFLVPEGKDRVPEEDISVVITELEKIDHLNQYPKQYHVESFDNSIWVYLSNDSPEVIADVLSMFPEEEERILDELSQGNHAYTAQMKFIRGEKDNQAYYVYRRTFSGLQKRDQDRWLFVAGGMEISEAAGKYVPHLERDSFYDMGI